MIGAAAYVLAIVNWFAILVAGEPIKGIRDFQLYYLRWRTRVRLILAVPHLVVLFFLVLAWGCSAPSWRGS